MKLCQSTIQEGHDLATGTVVVGGELTLAGAVGDALLYCPENGFVVVGSLCYVGEGVGSRGGSGFPLCTPQESGNLCSGALAVGENFPLPVPVVMFCSTAQRTAL